MTNLVVMKFGGTSVGGAKRIEGVAQIVTKTRQERPVVVVVSAMSQVTNMLVAAARFAARKQHEDTGEQFAKLEALHMKAIADLDLSKSARTKLAKTVSGMLADLKNLLDSIAALGELTPRGLDLIFSFGERMSSELVAAAIDQAGTPAVAVSATTFLITNDDFGDARPLLEKSRAGAEKTLGKLVQAGSVPVVTGFVGATAAGVTTTLGRGGSDYSATIVAYLLDAEAVWIYTDVDGAMTADPRLITDARTLPALSYDEAAELSYFGAKVLHPLTMVPAALKNIPIWVKNTFNSAASGTKISSFSHETETGAKAISYMSQVALITVQGQGMSGVPGVAARVFGTIAAERINVLFISQASSEFNISLIVRGSDGERAERVLAGAFEKDMASRDIETVKVETDLAMLSVIGEGMHGHPGVVGQLCTALGQAGVNIRAVAQGSSELNITLVIAQADLQQAAKAVHDSFGMERMETAA